jgi:transcriptional regulator with XRE-family HTH domain
MKGNPEMASQWNAAPEAATRTRRTAVAVEVERRMQARRARVGGDIRVMRLRRKWTQRELAVRADVGRLVVGRIERGQARLDVDVMERIALALGVALAVGFGRDAREDLADAGHLALQELVLSHTRAAGFSAHFELPTRPNEPWRSADVALGMEQRRLVIDAECWNTFGDLGAATRSSRRKLVELEQLAVARWGGNARARLVWIVRETTRNRDVVGRYPEIFASLFTGSSRAWIATLTDGHEPPDGPGLVWCDLASGRLHAWRRDPVRRRDPAWPGDPTSRRDSTWRRDPTSRRQPACRRQPA